jgi:hypothetical protein
METLALRPQGRRILRLYTAAAQGVSLPGRLHGACRLRPIIKDIPGLTERSRRDIIFIKTKTGVRAIGYVPLATDFPGWGRERYGGEMWSGAKDGTLAALPTAQAA